MSRDVGAGSGDANGWDQAEDWLESHSALFRIRSRLREPDKMVAWVWDIGDWRYTNLSPLGRYGSFDKVVYKKSPERIKILSDGAFLDLSLGGAETAALRGMITDAREHGAIPALLEMLATPLLARRIDALGLDAGAGVCTIDG